MSKAELQDHQWLMCITAALGADDLDIYFEDIAPLDETPRPEPGATEPPADRRG
jgi:hypothetical protein